MLDLPKPIAAYLAADAGDTDAIKQCFAEDATVRDEGKTHTGRAAIAAWKARTASEYQYTSTPVAARTDSGRHVVTAHVAGNFPGSPVDLDYAFTLENDLIRTLEIG
ncbi:nuclear transport factor 2 family protein [Martelella soudanensis]|uniref:nuclear transport factor 2 family protein n=1 Tax=unclassified Martelella TaxID=2629616 RepID=UPI0015DECA9B|nr:MULTISPECIES: nuclear transport factor 2 family protein [unclassified Martelella]